MTDATQLPLVEPRSNGSRPISKAARVAPVLKWAGGKTQVLERIANRIPSSFGTYIEPFLGGAALFYHLEPKSAILSDSNAELMNFYRVLARDPEGLMRAVNQWRTDKDSFYSVRFLRFEELEPVEAAARMLYLNKTCFNGLYRVNRIGQFNVPYGRYKNPRIYDPDRLLASSRALRKATLVTGDYKDVLEEHTQAGDFVYLDPPYVPVSKWGDFKRYTPNQFRDGDHRELAQAARRLVDKGCHVLLSNSSAPLVKELYEGDFVLEEFPAKRYINKNGADRTGMEVLIWPK